MPLNILRQSIRRLISPRPVLLQTLHHHPIQIPAEQRYQFLRIHPPPLRRRRRIRSRHPAQSIRRPHRIRLPNPTPHLIHPRLHQLLRIKWRSPRQKLIQQNPQTVDIAPSINIQRAHLRLLGAHIRRRPHKLLKLRVNRLLRQIPLRRLRDPKINHLRHRNPIMQRHQNIRRLNVPMNNPLLMRMLNRMTDIHK